MFYEVIPTKLFRASSDPSAGILTYSSDSPLFPGQIVLVPLGRYSVPAIVYKKVAHPSFPTKPVKKILYSTPLPAHLLKSLFWLSSYYLSPLPQVANLLLPTGITKKRRTSETTFIVEKSSNLSKIALNPHQKTALRRLESVSTATKLLHGITGSGKTNIYLRMAEKALKAQKSVILLVPEISLTPQIISAFKNTFSEKIFLIHSRETEAERHLLWENILNEKEPCIVIGPRSALLSPVNKLGLIIIDEAHESSYYQENPPRYSALRLASFIANSLKIPCLQGTATPLISDYYLAEKNQALVPLTEKAKSSAKPPKVHIIDLKSRENFPKSRYFSAPLLSAIEENLKNHHQTLIFHNRRGSSPLTICENCGWQALCPTCFLPLTLHSDSYHLICHTCGHEEKIPLSCPDCEKTGIIHKGFGTKLLESELKKLFKDAKIARFDADNTKSDSLEALYGEVKSGNFDIIVGTQTIAKGLDLPNLATVGVVQADGGLSLPDFAAEERTFHLLTQVLGRIGRGHLEATEAFIQTFQPDHPIITAAIRSDYPAFYSYLLKKRQKSAFPPFTYLARLSLTYKTEQTVLKHIKTFHSLLLKNPDISVSRPTPAFHERSTKGYTWQLTLKAKNRKKLLSAINNLPQNPNLRIILDPPSLL